MHTGERRSGQGDDRDGGEVERRLYATLIVYAGTRTDDARLCAKLAALAGRLYARRSLDDAEIDAMLGHLSRD